MMPDRVSRRLFTAPQALRYIARKILRAGKIETGLCWELDKLYAWGRVQRIGADELERAKLAIQAHVDSEWIFIAPRGTCVEERAMFALLLAEQLEDAA